MVVALEVQKDITRFYVVMKNRMGMLYHACAESVETHPGLVACERVTLLQVQVDERTWERVVRMGLGGAVDE